MQRTNFLNASMSLALSVLAVACLAAAASAEAPLRTLVGHVDDVWCVAFSPDGRVLASASEDGTIKLWNAATGALVRTLEGHARGVNSLAFSPDGQLLASGSNDWTVKLWNARTGDLLRTLEEHEMTVQSVAFSPDGRVLASGSYDDTIKLWNATTWALVRTLDAPDVVDSVAFSPKGGLIAGVTSFAGKITLWDAATGALVHTIGGERPYDAYSIAFSPDGKLVASASVGALGTVRLWDPRTGALVRTWEGDSDWIFSVAFSPDGKVLASGGGSFVRLWDTTTGDRVGTSPYFEDDILSVAFSPDGKIVACGSEDGTLKLWYVGIQATPEEPPARPTPPRGPSSGQVGNALAFSTGGATCGSGSATEYLFDWGDGTSSAWSPATTASRTYVEEGEYSVRARARCSSAPSVLSDWSTPVSVRIVPGGPATPPATPAGPSTGKVGDDLTFSTGGSSCGSGSVVEYRFDWGVTSWPDKARYSSWSTTGRASVTYDAAGPYQIRAQARCSTDTSTFSDWSAPLSVVVIPRPQQPVFVTAPSRPTGPDMGYVGEKLTFTSGGAKCTGDGQSVEYMFDWGDGTKSDWSSSPSASHTYWSLPSAMTTVSVRTRCAGKHDVVSSEYVNRVIHISPRPPDAPTGPSSGPAGTEVSFCTSGAVFSNVNYRLKYQFDWGDGSSPEWNSSTCQTHTYRKDGRYGIRVKARLADDPGCMLCITESDWSATTLITVAVPPVPPRLSEVHAAPFILTAEGGFERESSNAFTASGRVSLRGEGDAESSTWVEFVGSKIVVDTTQGKESIKGDGSLVLKKIPWIGSVGDVTLWKSPFEFKLREVTSFSIDGLREMFEFAGYRLEITKAHLATEEGRLIGVVLDEVLLKVHNDIDDDSEETPAGYIKLTDIAFTQKGVAFSGGTTRVEKLKFAGGLYTLDYLELLYEAEGNRMRGSGQASCPMPFGQGKERLTLTASALLANGKLTEFSLDVEASKMARQIWALPPIFLNRVRVGVTVTQEDIEVRLGCAVTLLPQIDEFYLVKLDMDLSVLLGDGAFKATGKATIIGDKFGIFSVSVEHDPKGKYLLAIEAQVDKDVKIGAVVLAKGHLNIRNDGSLDGRFEAGKLGGALELADIVLKADVRGIPDDTACGNDPVIVFTMNIGDVEGVVGLAEARACMWKDGRISIAAAVGKLFDTIQLAEMAIDFDADGLVGSQCPVGAILCIDARVTLLVGAAEGRLYVLRDGSFGSALSMTAFMPPESPEWQWFWDIMECAGQHPQSFEVASIEINKAGLRFKVDAVIGRILVEFDPSEGRWYATGEGPDFGGLVAAAQEAAGDPLKTLGDVYKGATDGLACVAGKVYEALPPEAKGVVNWGAGTLQKGGEFLGSVIGYFSGCDMLVVDAQGRRLGRQAGVEYKDIPGAFFFTEADEQLFLLPRDLDFRIEIRGDESTTGLFSYAAPSTTGVYAVASYALPLSPTVRAELEHARGRLAEPLRVHVQGDGTYETIVQPVTIATSSTTATADAPAVFSFEGPAGLRSVRFLSTCPAVVSKVAVSPVPELPPSVQSPSYPVLTMFSVEGDVAPECLRSIELRFGVPSVPSIQTEPCRVALFQFDQASSIWRSCGTSLIGQEAGFFVYAAQVKGLGLMAACLGAADHAGAILPESVVCFKDPALKECVRAALKLTTADVTLADMSRLTKLSFSPQSKADLAGLERAVHLQELWIHGSELADLSPIAGLGELKRLDLSCPRIGRFDSLAQLAQLEELILSGIDVGDLPHLSGLANLVRLNISATKLSELSKLTGLTRLRELWLVGNEISDISALAKLTQLEVLELQCNRVHDISPLKGLLQLRELQLWENQITDISPLAYNSGRGGLGKGDEVIVTWNPLKLGLFSRNAAAIRQLERAGCNVFCSGMPWLTPGGFWALVGGSFALLVGGGVLAIRWRRHHQKKGEHPSQSP